jgi:uncharacterized membrane-anchored protein YhcB (DUF1043 family)
MLVGLIVGVIIGYVAFAPGMASMRNELWSKINGLVGGPSTPIK